MVGTVGQVDWIILIVQFMKVDTYNNKNLELGTSKC